MERTFNATAEQQLDVEFGTGSLTIACTNGDQVVVHLEGRDCDEVTVEQRGDTVIVHQPRKAGFFASHHRLAATVTLPHGSHVRSKLGSADVTVTGELGSARLVTGSGDVSLERVAGTAELITGSGDVSAGEVLGAVNLKTGSGDVKVDNLGEGGRFLTGSGDISLGRSGGPVDLKSGSGDLTVEESAGHASLSSGSGDLRVVRVPRGEVRFKNASGDIRVGIPAGTPVWTDLTSVTGAIRSTVAPTGAPTEGQDHVRVLAKTATGDIYLDSL